MQVTFQTVCWGFTGTMVCHVKDNLKIAVVATSDKISKDLGQYFLFRSDHKEKKILGRIRRTILSVSSAVGSRRRSNLVDFPLAVATFLGK